MNRRQLLLRGALIAMLGPVVRAAETIVPRVDSGTDIGGTAQSLLVVQDPMYRRSREFALGLEQRGARRHSLVPDAMACWHRELRNACTAGKQARIAGLTTQTDFLVLRDLARTEGLATLIRQDVDRARVGIARDRATLIAWVLAPRDRASDSRDLHGPADMP